MNSQNYESNFRENVRKTRLSKGYSQEQLAIKSGLDRTYISLIERGKRSPTLSVMAKIANSLDIHLTQLIS